MRCFLLRILGLIGVALGGCIDRYTPAVLPAAQANLVVDGLINPLSSSIIKRARTFSVNTKNTAPAEARAQVAIQDNAAGATPWPRTRPAPIPRPPLRSMPAASISCASPQPRAANMLRT